MIKKNFLVCISLLLLSIPLKSKKVFDNFIESSNVNKNSNEISVVVALNEELNDARLITFTDDLKYNQELIMKIRAQNKKNYQEKNNLFSKEHIKTNGKIKLSDFSPFIFITFDNYESYLIEKENVQNLSKNDNVDSVYVIDYHCYLNQHQYKLQPFLNRYALLVFLQFVLEGCSFLFPGNAIIPIMNPYSSIKIPI